MEKKKNQDSTTKTIGTLMTILAILIIASTFLSNLESKNASPENKVNVSTDKESRETEDLNVRKMNLDKLVKMGERDRMEYYFSYFIDLIENNSYETAYDMLYYEFKESYFNTLSKFKEYCNTTFPKMANLNYTNIERNGEIYVLWVDMSDVLDGRKDEFVSLNVVIKENDFADIEMSFSVI